MNSTSADNAPNAPPHTSSDSPLSDNVLSPAPFLLRLHKEQADRHGRFLPAATVAITPSLRTSGLLLALPAEELRSLLLLLTFVSPEGNILPSLPELAHALHVPPFAAQRRMQRLERIRWQDKPLVHSIRRESGLHAWSPTPRLLTTFQEAQTVIADSAASPWIAAGREAVIAHSRATYARPRAEVEAEMARRNGWTDYSRTATPGKSLPAVAPSAVPAREEPDDIADVRQRLREIGVKPEQVDMVLARFSLDRIARQIAWLPLRQARNPAALLLSAIEHDYAPPPDANLPPVTPSP